MRRLAFLVATASVVACGGSDATTPGQGFRGDYTLQTVNGKSLPYRWDFAGGNYYVLRSYRFTILPGGGWLSAISYSYTDQGKIIDRPTGGEAGTYTYTPGTGDGFVSLLSQDQTTFLIGTVSLDERTMTITENGDVYVYRR